MSALSSIVESDSESAQITSAEYCGYSRPDGKLTAQIEEHDPIFLFEMIADIMTAGVSDGS